MKILVPTDFSKNAQRAIDYAVKIAEKSLSEIVLLHAYQIIDTASPTRKFLFEEYNYSIARKLHDEVKVQRKRIAKINPGIKVTAELSDNETKKSIIDESIGKDLIVMGTQGASGLKKIFMGSTTASIIGTAAVPVLAIPRSYKWREPKNILFVTDRFETDPNILEDIFQLVRSFKACLHVIIFSDGDGSENEDHLKNHKKELDNYQNFLVERYKDMKITSAHLKGREFEVTVQQYINENSIDMVAMITYKRNFLEGIFHRSATRKMAYRTQIPLLSVPGANE